MQRSLLQHYNGMFQLRFMGDGRGGKERANWNCFLDRSTPIFDEFNRWCRWIQRSSGGRVEGRRELIELVCWIISLQFLMLNPSKTGGNRSRKLVQLASFRRCRWIQPSSIHAKPSFDVGWAIFRAPPKHIFAICFCRKIYFVSTEKSGIFNVYLLGVRC